jgi:hypothetical protein
MLPKIPLALAACLSLLATAPAHAQAFDLPDIPRCTELVPGAIAAGNTPVTLGLRVVLDGVSASQAQPLVAAAQSSYAPLGISLSVSYQSANFSARDGLGLLQEAKLFFGGRRPDGVHLVYVLTSKNLTDEIVGDALAGQADCIGGVVYPENAFAVGEFDSALGAKIMAHELGHLFGGHHHYANCAEALFQGGDNLCTLMINDVGLAALPVATLNGLVMRGHAQLAGAATPASANPSPSGGGGGASGFGLLLILLGATLLRARAGARGL